MNYTEVKFPGLGINIDINPVAFSIGGFDVYWYGIIIAAAMLLAIFLGVKDSKKLNFPTSLIYDFILVAIPVGIIGARAYFILFNLDYYSQDWSRVIDTRSGGLAIYGGVLGAALGAYIMCKIRKISFTALADYVIVYVPLAQAIGRWGNFFNQEAFGTTTNLPWGITSDTVVSYLTTHCPALDASCPVHPTFLYESLADFALFIILYQVRKRSKHAFETASVYFLGYGFARFFIEGLRTDSLYIASTNIRVSQLLSFVLCIVSVAAILIVHAKGITRRKFPARFYVEEGASAGKKDKVSKTEEAAVSDPAAEDVAEETADDTESTEETSDEISE